MGLTFFPFQQNVCCLCGSTKDLSGEHKIKASLLRKEFGASQMVIGRSSNSTERMRSAQSPKSKALHFKARICASCNSHRTQAADREFDKFHRIVQEFFSTGDDPKRVFDSDRYATGSKAYLNVFRYFAKLLCCHMADSCAPRSRHMSNFALGQVNANCVWLDIDRDWSYTQASAVLGPHQYAAHGGLLIFSDKKSGSPNAFHSTLTLGSVRYVFFSRLNWIERLELRIDHQDFYEWCRARGRETMDHPMSEQDRLMLGLSVEKPPSK